MVADVLPTLVAVGDAVPDLRLALELTVAATAMMLLASLAVRAARRRGAAARHMIWSVAAAGLLALPLLRAALPEWHLTSAGPRAADVGSLESSLAAAPDRGPGQRPVRKVVVPGEGEPARTDSADDAAVPTVVVALDRYLLPLWAAGTGVVVLWICSGMVGIGAVVRRADEVDDPGLLEAAGEAARDVGEGSLVRLRWSDEVEVPVVAGLVRPVILLPGRARGWSHERVRWTLVHELTHALRHDVAVGVLARLACAVYWFHPAIWHLAARIDVERERACDERVAELRGDPLGYADELLRAAAEAFERRRLPGFVPAGAPSALEERIEGLLDRRSRARQPGLRDVAAGLALSLLVAAPLAAATLSPPPDDSGSSAEPAMAESSVREPPPGERSVDGSPADTASGGDGTIQDPGSVRESGPVQERRSRWERTLDAIDRDREIFLAAAAEITGALATRISSEREVALDDAAARALLLEAARDLWNHLDIEVWTPRDAPEGTYPSVGVQGESHLQVRSWDGDRRIARVEAGSGPFSAALPDAVFRRLPANVAGEDPGLRRELASAGERLAAFWEAHLERTTEERRGTREI